MQVDTNGRQVKFAAKQVIGPDNEVIILPAINRDPGGIKGTGSRPHMRFRYEFEDIGQCSGTKYRFDVMKAIGSFLDDVQSQVDLGIGKTKHADRDMRNYGLYNIEIIRQ
jgi:hypothetical protein